MCEDSERILASRRPKFVCCLLAFSIILSGMVVAQDSRIRIEEIEVSATRVSRAISNIAGTVSVISEQEIERQLINDLDDLARYQPGVSMETASRGGHQGFSIRGIGGNRVLTVIDGIRSSDIYGAGPSSYGKDSFEMDDLKSVEIIRGPSSVLYGADAMGGAVLLRTKSPRDYVNGENQTYFSVQTSNASANEMTRAGFTGAWQAENFGTIIQYTAREFSEFDVNGKGSLNPQDGDSEGLLVKAFWDISDSQQLSIVVDQYEEQNDVMMLSDLSRSVSSSIGSDTTNRDRFGIGYSWAGDLTFFDAIDLKIQKQNTDALQHTEQNRTSYSFINPRNPRSFAGTSSERVTDFEFNQDTFAFGLNLRKEFVTSGISHEFVYGFNHDETDTERPRNRCETEISSGAVVCKISAYPMAPTENFPNKTFPDTITERQGFYAQDEISLPELGLTIIPGLRYDSYKMIPLFDPSVDSSGIIAGFGGFSLSEVDVDATSASLGIIYDFGAQSSIFLQYAEGYRPPNFDESNQAFVNLGYSYATVPNANLSAESSESFEVGIRQSLDNAYLSVSAFQNTYSDFIESKAVGSAGRIALYQDQNSGAATISGLEVVSAFYLTDNWNIQGSIAYARGTNDITDKPIDSVQPVTTVISSGYDSPENNWGAELLMTLVQRKDRVSSDEVVTGDNYIVADLLGYYTFNQSHSLRGGVFNILDEEYARWSSIQGLSKDSIENLQNATQPGINLRISYKYEF